MFKSKLIYICLFLSQIVLSSRLWAAPLTANELNLLLRKADATRLTSDHLLVETEVQLFVKDQLDKERRYLVYVKPGRSSIVLSKSPTEVGQKILMVGDDFWIILPGSQRPVRISPVQKLLGDASTGDIANLSWADDYEAVSYKDVQTGTDLMIELELKAIHTGVTYQKIILTLNKSNSLPVTARLFVSADKEAKKAEFKSHLQTQMPLIDEMVVHDLIQPNRKTIIRYLKREPFEISNRFFNPNVLVKESPVK